jgi:tRNA A-37 threonylcarbamoyl transferase component Bud32
MKFVGQSRSSTEHCAPIMRRTDKLVIAPGWESLLRSQRWDAVAAVFEVTAGRAVTRSGSTEVRRLAVGEGPNQRILFLKKYWVNRPAQLWSGMLRGTFFGRSKVRREYENLARLRGWGLDAPPPVAYGEERCARWLLRSFLLSEGVPDPRPLDVFIRDDLRVLLPAEQRLRRRELIRRLADYTRRLQHHRFVHHDYFWRNILLTGRSLDHFHLIDAHKGRCWRSWEAGACQVKDLAALDAPAPWFFRRTERLRFFLAYREHTRLTFADKQLIRRVLRQAGPLRGPQLQRVQDAKADRV